VLEEPPKRPTKGSDPRSFHIVTCSAHSQASLDQNKRSMLQLLKGNGSISLANLSYTTTARRTHHALRAAYCGSSVQDITEALSQDLSHKGQELSNREVKTPVVFVFSGQGVCYAGMGQELFKTSSQFRRIITDLERACQSLGFPSFTNLIAGLDAGMECISIVQLHLSLVALQIALTDLWKIWGVEPDIVMGHSIGEYAALHAAGVLSAFDAMYLVGKRAQLIQSKCFAGTYAMVSISGTTNEVSMLLSEGDFNGCEVACFNSPGMVVFSGERAEILTLKSLLKERGFKCQLLEIPYGMHSRQMDAMSSDFGDILAGVRFGEPKVKIVSTFLGHLVTKASSFGRDYFVSHTRDPVKFQQAVESCITGRHADASSIWLEIGPGATCLGLIRANVNIHSSNALASLRKGENNWKTIVASLAAFYSYKKHIHWREYHKDFIDNLSHIDLPRYAFDTKNFWIKYKSNEGLESNGAVIEEDRKSEVISTCLHRRLERPDDEDKQSASFTTTISHLPLMQIIEGHKLSGITVCPAGVFIDMALTAVRNLLTGGDFTSPQPSLSVSDFQINHPVVPVSGSQKVIQVDITRSKRLVTEFSVSFSENSGSLSSTIGKCVVRFRDQSIFDIQHQELFHSIQPKITRLRVASETGLADRIGGKVFYKLFSHLMDYSAAYKGVESAIISGDFKQIIADVRLPLHDRRRLDENFTLSPYWIDILAQSIGFLLNGNPDQTDDYVHIATHIERIDIEARDFAPNVRYRIHAYIDHSKGSDSQGHVFVLHGDTVVGVLEGVAFRKMPRKRFLHILGSTTPMKPNEPAALESGTQPHKSTIQLVSLAATFLKILLEETGMLESELISFALFSEIGVDSMMSISILAGLKAETGVELGASFLIENPTVEDAQRALRMIENQNSTLAERNALTNRHKSGLAPNTLRESNVVLMSGRVDTPSRTPLFLIADGAGSAAAYTHLPELATDLQVFALESPWVHDPESFTCTFSEAAAIYLMAVRTKQPRGPYLLGGWSGGGVFAFEVARLLLEAGEKVSGLIIIDIHAPQHVDRTKVTMPTFELVEQIGMLAGIDRATPGISPQSLERKKHMFNTVRCFSKLDPTPMAPGYQPDATFVIWATENSCLKNRNTMSGSNLDAWFYLSEHDFGPNGWDFLVGDKVECFQVQGDHFSIMNTPRVSCPKAFFDSTVLVRETNSMLM
jgi:iterative type I PKS product template protein